MYRPLGYFLIFLGLLLEGEFILFTAAFLTHQGVFGFGHMAVVVVVGVLMGDVLWYLAGTRLAKTHYRWQKWFNRIAGPFDRHIMKRPFHTIFISKFTYGLYHVIVLRAGILGVKLRDFLKADLPSVFIWSVVVGGLGYGASAFFLLLRHYLRFFEMALLLGLVSFFLILHLISRRIREEL